MSAPERAIHTEVDLRAIPNEVRLGPSGVSLAGWLWEVEPASFGFPALTRTEPFGWMGPRLRPPPHGRRAVDAAPGPR